MLNQVNRDSMCRLIWIGSFKIKASCTTCSNLRSMTNARERKIILFSYFNRLGVRLIMRCCQRSELNLFEHYLIFNWTYRRLKINLQNKKKIIEYQIDDWIQTFFSFLLQIFPCFTTVKTLAICRDHFYWLK